MSDILPPTTTVATPVGALASSRALFRSTEATGIAAAAVILLFALVAGCSTEPSLPLEHGSPWPKFRGNAAQDGTFGLPLN